MPDEPASSTPPRPPAAAVATRPVRVWDLPTRLFHWTLAACVAALLVTGHLGGNAIAWHMRLGYVVMGLVLFRIVWGLVGGRWSRFVHFVRGPGTVLRYLRGQARPGEHLDVGHNPLGAGSVLALLTLLALQVATGLVIDDEIATTGPLNRFVSSDLASSATHWHRDVGQIVLTLLVLLHIGAILYYRVRQKVDLVRPMLTGDKDLPPSVPASSDGAGPRLLAAVLVAACAAVVTWVVRLGG